MSVKYKVLAIMMFKKISGGEGGHLSDPSPPRDRPRLSEGGVHETPLSDKQLNQLTLEALVRFIFHCSASEKWPCITVIVVIETTCQHDALL